MMAKVQGMMMLLWRWHRTMAHFNSDDGDIDVNGDDGDDDAFVSMASHDGTF